MHVALPAWSQGAARGAVTYEPSGLLVWAWSASGAVDGHSWTAHRRASQRRDACGAACYAAARC